MLLSSQESDWCCSLMSRIFYLMVSFNLCCNSMVQFVWGPCTSVCIFSCAFTDCRDVTQCLLLFFPVHNIVWRLFSSTFLFAYFYAILIFHELSEGDVVQWSLYPLKSQSSFFPVKFVIVPFRVASPLPRLLVLAGHSGNFVWVHKWLDFLASSGFLLVLTCCPHGQNPCSLQLLFSPWSTSLPVSCFESLLILGVPDTPFIPSVFLSCRCW